MKLISWNVNGIRASYKKGLSEFLSREKPDIFCVQETKAQIEQVDDAIRNLMGPFNYWSSAEKKGYSGTATFVRENCQNVDRGIGINEYDREGRFVVTHHKKFDLYNVYFPNGARGPDRHKYKMSFLVDFAAFLKKQIAAGKQIIVVGDYNIAPTDLDIYDPVRHAKTSGFLPEEKEWYKTFLGLGFVDSYRHFYPDKKDVFTWWNQIERARIHNRGWRIDMICVTKGLLPFVTSASILDHVEGSDHCPTAIEFKGTIND